MNEQEFMRLIKKDRYQVFVFCSNIALPLSFINHTWIVTSEKGIVNRYDIFHRKKKEGHLYINLLRSWEGLGFVFWNRKPRWNSHLLWTIDGGKNSLAEKIVRFMKKSSTYPFKKKYHFFPGPNSNTFVQWILDQFRDISLKLPWNALGKNYRRALYRD